MSSSAKYSGYEELKAFVQKHKQPIFKSFVKENQRNLVLWSVNLTAYSARILNCIWIERYKQVLMEVRGTAVCAKNIKFKELLWNDIMASVSRRRKLAKTYIDEGISTLTYAAPVSSQEARKAIQQWCKPSSSSGGTVRSTTTHTNNSGPISSITVTTSSSRPHAEPQRETNEFLFSVAAKKLRNEVDPLETAQLQTYVTKGHTIRDKMTNHAIHLLSKKNLTILEIELVKLLLCSVVDLLDPLAYETMKAIITDKQLKHLMKNDTFNRESYGIDLVALAKLNEIVENCKSLESLLKTVLQAKIDLIDSKERDSDTYKMLCILETVGEYMDIPLNEKTSEAAVYRRFAVLLDLLFAGLHIEMKDGEVIANATRSAMEQNGHEISQSQGRKIDLLLVTEGRELELASNEWKTFRSKHLILQRQSKNLRCNAAILNNLYISSKGKVSSVMAVDFVGTVGYMYLLVLKGDIYVPTVIQSLFLPTDISQLPTFIDTIKGLFVWKGFLEEQVRILKLTTLKRKLDDIVYIPTTDDCKALPTIFFTPKRTRKRSIGEVY